MTFTSVKTRFLVSVGANVLRAGISFITGLLVARGLSPTGYGDLAYLLGSFMAIRVLMDMGSSNAFYTLISQQARGRKFYVMYYLWLLTQFTISVLLVAVLMPQVLIDRIWLGNSREIILLALLAAFMQQQVWTTVTQLGESTRQTVKVQLLGVSVIALHLLVILILIFAQWLSIAAVLVAIIFEYLLATMVSTRLLHSAFHARAGSRDESVEKILAEYWKYCRPLILLAVASFAYEFVDRWMLQRYGGAAQQGFYQISAQLAGICLLATSSILNIFWKEISEANARLDKQRVAYLYNKVNRVLLMFAATVSCFMIPWSEELVHLLLGPAYQQSWVVFAVMLLYPIHQSMGQVNGTMFLACGQTRKYTVNALWGQVVSIPVTYLLLAPGGDTLIPGLGLGALGLAIKMVGMNILLVNVQAWLIARLNGWQYEWRYQVVGISLVLATGFLAKNVTCFLIPITAQEMEKIRFVLALSVAGVIYLAGVVAFLWLCPQIAGIDKAELRAFAAKCNPLRRASAK